jgi:HlyD family secretion protein
MDRKLEKKKGIRPKHVAFTFAGIALVLLLMYMVNSAGTSIYRADKEKLTISTVENGSFRDYISIISTVEPMVTIFLDAEEGGKVLEKIIDEGEMVNEGEIIVRLQNNDLNLQILNTESQLAYQSNELRNTLINMEQQKINNKHQLLLIDHDLVRLRRNYEQNTGFYEKGFISKEQFLVSQENYQLAHRDRELRYERMVQDSIFRENQKIQMDHSLRNMQQNLLMVQQRIENLNIKAPATGQLGTLNIEIGQQVIRGERIGQLQILDNFKVVAQVDEHYIDRVRRNLTATFERQDRQFGIEVAKVYPEVRDGKFKVDLHFTGEIPDNLRTGQTYHIRLELGQPTEAILLPRGGFFQSTGGQWVFVLDESGKTATQRSIRIGRQNPLYYEVLEGLSPGEQVITNSYELFGANTQVSFR